MWKAVRLFFAPLTNFVADNTPQLLVLAAFVVVLASYVWPEATWHGNLRPYALTLLGAGFFAYLAKGALFRGLLRQEISTLLQSSEHKVFIAEALAEQIEKGALRRVLNEDVSRLICGPVSLMDRKDLLPIFQNVVMAGGLPKAIAEIACADLLQKVWDPARPFYYSGLTRSHRLAWVDAAAGVLSVTSRISGALHNAIPGSAFMRTHRVAADPKSKVSSAPATTSCVVTSLTDGKRYTSSYKVSASNPDVWVNEMQLPGDSSFQVEEEWTYNIDVDEDNVIACETPVFVVNSMWVTLHYDSLRMKVILSAIGKGAEFGEETGSPGSEQRELPGLTSPGSGYIVTVQRA